MKKITSTLTAAEAIKQYGDTHNQVIAAVNRARASVGLGELPWHALRPFWVLQSDYLNDSKYHCDWFETEIDGVDFSEVFEEQLSGVRGINAYYAPAVDTTHGVVVYYK